MINEVHSTIFRLLDAAARRLGAVPLFGRLKSFRRNSRATAAIEFALLGMVTFEIIFETMQVGIYFYFSSALERATWKATRIVRLGTATGQSFGSAGFRDQICALLPSGMSCGNVVINVQTVAPDVYPNGFYKFVRPDLSSVILPAADNTASSYCSGQAKSYVYAQISYAMPLFSAAWKAIGATQWKGTPVHFVTSQVVFRNEPYLTSGSGC